MGDVPRSNGKLVGGSMFLVSLGELRTVCGLVHVHRPTLAHQGIKGLIGDLHVLARTDR